MLLKLIIISGLVLITISGVWSDKETFEKYIIERAFGAKADVEGPDKGGISQVKMKPQVLLLLQFVTLKYMMKCGLVVLYHSSFKFDTREANFNLPTLFKTIPIPFAHGGVTRNERAKGKLLEPPGQNCVGYVVFANDVLAVQNIVGNQTISKAYRYVYEKSSLGKGISYKHFVSIFESFSKVREKSLDLLKRLQDSKEQSEGKTYSKLSSHYWNDIPSVRFFSVSFRNRVVVVTASSRWKIQEVLESPPMRNVVNLLVIATTGAKNIVIRKGEKSRSDDFINMYSHDIFVDGTGSSTAKLITSWKGNQISRNVTLFPPKMQKGFNGRQFKVVGSEQVPFTIKKSAENISSDADTTALWDGIEVRLLKLIAPFLNFTIQITEAEPLTLLRGPAEGVIKNLVDGNSEIGIGGVYKTADYLKNVSMSAAHSVDCATFILRTSTALPRYRAILGPFQWTVWLALTLTYMLAILPLTFAEKHSFRYLLDHPWHAETLFWYVFGTFTNLFTFGGTNAWTKSDKHATRMLVGWYWAFSIIVTACYTGSIIAFITLFVFPPTIDSVAQLYEENYRIGSLSTGGWGTWFNNSDHPQTKWLLRDIELVPNVTQGVLNVTKSFYLPLFRPYAFLGSRAQLEHIVQTNFTLKNSKTVLHLVRECFAPFGVSLVYPHKAPYAEKINEFVLRSQQSGLMTKIFRDMQWELQRSGSGARLQAGLGAPLRQVIVADRRLALDDTQGMFLLLGAGFLIATASFLSETFRHRQAAKLSFRFWKWRPASSSTRRLREFICVYFPSKALADVDAEPDVDAYKTYDSRVLNSRFRGVSPHDFRSKSYVIGEGGVLERTTSMPGLWLQVPRMEEVKLSSSWHELSASHSAEAFAMSVDKEAKTQCGQVSIRFGSVGSALNFDCRHVLVHDFNADRPYTSQN